MFHFEKSLVLFTLDITADQVSIQKYILRLLTQLGAKPSPANAAARPLLQTQLHLKLHHNNAAHYTKKWHQAQTGSGVEVE